MSTTRSARLLTVLTVTTPCLNPNPNLNGRYVLTQESITKDERVRQAAEDCFLSLFEAHEALVAPLVVQMLASTLSPAAVAATPTPALPEVLLTDAVYVAMGLVSFKLGEYLEFAPWCRQVLLPMLQATGGAEVETLTATVLQVGQTPDIRPLCCI